MDGSEREITGSVLVAPLLTFKSALAIFGLARSIHVLQSEGGGKPEYGPSTHSRDDTRL